MVMAKIMMQQPCCGNAAIAPNLSVTIRVLQGSPVAGAASPINPAVGLRASA